MSKLYRGNLNRKKKGSKILLLFAITIIAFFIIKGCIYSVHAISKINMFKIKAINIFAPSNINQKTINDLSEIKEGESLYGVSIDSAMERIRTNSWVKKVTIKRSFPDTIEITVVSKNAVALVKKDKKLFYIDEEGNLIDKFIPGYKNNLVVINASPNEYLNSLQLLKNINNLKTDNIYIKSDLISEIISEPDNVFTLLLAGFEFKILIKPDHLEHDLIRIQKVIADLENRHEKAILIDATLSDNRIVVRK